MVNIVVTTKKGEKPFPVEANTTVGEFKKMYAKETHKSIHRLSFKFNMGETVVRLDDDRKKMSEIGVTEGTKLEFKDLGPQISYRGVFIVEYLGPLVIVLLYALRPAFIFGAEAASAPWNPIAKLAVLCWTLHFAKREFETLFIHKFSRPTMPLSNLFKNCTYYWSFGAFIGYPLAHPAFTAPSDMHVKVGLAIFILSELGNLITHIMLSGLRKGEGEKLRPIPKGFLFDLVSCPNYTCEVMSWVGFSIMTSTLFSWAFTLVGFLQMTEWAIKKHKAYLKDYSEYKGLRRKAIVPFLL